MAVVTISQEQKEKMYGQWKAGAFESKAAMARHYLTSARTVGRIIDEMNELEVETIHEEIDMEFADDGPSMSDSEPKDSYMFTASPFSLTIVRQSDGKQVSVTKDADGFDAHYDAIMDGRGSQQVLAYLFSMLDVTFEFKKYSKNGIFVDAEAGIVYYESGAERYNFSGKLVPRLISSLSDEGEYSDSFEGLLAFTEKLLDNPEKRAVNELYDFLEANDVTITKEGMVRCWKKVTSDWKDFHTRSIDNSVGTVVKMPRHLVNNDSSQTCSTGLHACSKSYLSSFGGSDNRVVSVLVNPADFVSIPNDYNNAKARVCRYVVEAEVDPYTLEVKKNEWSYDDDFEDEEDVEDEYDY